MKRILSLLTALSAGCVASATVLYDAPSSNVRPDDPQWGWSYGSAPAGAVVTGPAGSGYVTLDTSASMGIAAGWYKISPVDLNRTTGYDIDWNLKLVSESHDADDQRAGLSVFALGDDHEGVELGYWDNEIFAYNDDAGFTPGESVAFDPTSGMHSYDLNVSGDSYTLSIDGVAELHGALRDYSAFGPPYSIANGLWVGDDTSRGESVSEWQSFSATPAPEPLPWCALAVCAFALIRRRKAPILY